jgi:hypothetical protein
MVAGGEFVSSAPLSFQGLFEWQYPDILSLSVKTFVELISYLFLYFWFPA